MNTLTVDLGERSYPIYIGENTIENTELWKTHLAGHKQICIVTNDTLSEIYLEKLTQIIHKSSPDSTVITAILKDGEQYKNLASIELIYNELMTARFNRDAIIIALGGGVIGDMAGFAAASFLRGIDFIQVPTTLLAQVDSSVGGKTGINHPLGKNMIGAFHQPKAVLIDTNTLSTLSERHFKAGLAEIIKYGLIIDEKFLTWLEDNMPAILGHDIEACTYIIEKSCEIKAHVVSQDEKESGLRAILNLGHTFGHAIESCLNYKDWLHGEAISVGMVMAADLSHRMQLIEKDDLDRVKQIFLAAGLPIEAPSHLANKDIYNSMHNDKKVLAGKIRLILMEKIGKAFVTSEYAKDHLIQVLNDFFPTK